MMTIHPADGLINRLLQQNSRPASTPARKTAPAVGHVTEPVDTSSTARDRDNASSEIHKHAGERQLESHLLQLYRSNARTGK